MCNIELNNGQLELNNGLLTSFFTQFNWNYKNVLENKNPYTCKRKIKISVLDTGIDSKHPFFSQNRLTGKSYVDNSNGLTDELGHGTQVVGVLDTLINNLEIISYKIMDKNRTNISLNLVKSIFDSVDEGAHIISISFGTYKDINLQNDKRVFSAFNKAINYAYENNVAIVSSAGNDYTNLDHHDKIHLPSSHNKVISVGGSTKNHSIAPYSNYGNNIDIYAPAGLFEFRDGELDVSEMIISYSSSDSIIPPINPINDRCDIVSFTYGTSIAVPHVVAALAVEYDLYPNKHIEFYKKRLLNKASKYKTPNGSFFKEVRMYN